MIFNHKKLFFEKTSLQDQFIAHIQNIQWKGCNRMAFNQTLSHDRCLTLVNIPQIFNYTKSTFDWTISVTYSQDCFQNHGKFHEEQYWQKKNISSLSFSLLKDVNPSQLVITSSCMKTDYWLRHLLLLTGNIIFLLITWFSNFDSFFIFDSTAFVARSEGMNKGQDLWS